MWYVLASIVAGLVFPRLEYTLFPNTIHDIAVASAQALLSAVASGMMALTAIVFSLAFVIIQFSGSAYSPRLVSLFARDRLLYQALGVFIATFVYALATLSFVDRDENGFVPLVSTYIVLALVIWSVLLLGMLVLRIGELQVTNVLRTVSKRGRSVIDSLPTLRNDPVPAGVLLSPSDPPAETIRYTGIPMVVDGIDTPRLVQMAAERGGLIQLSCCIGDSLTENLTVMNVYAASMPLPQDVLQSTFRLARERSFEDPKFAFRLLVDIAIKALSPAINDPTTAVQALDEIEDLLQRLATRQIDNGIYRDAAGTVRLILPAATWNDYMLLAFDEIRDCGASQIQVLRRMRAALKALESTTAGTPRADSVRHYLQHLDSTVETAQLDPVDRATAAAEDRQGLGISHSLSEAPQRTSARP